MGTVVGGVLFIAGSLQPQPVRPVKGYDTFKSPDSSFACKYPSGWSKSSSQSHATDASASFREGDARISVESSLAGSLVSDLPALPGGAGLEEIPNVPGASEINEKIRNAKRAPVE